MNYLFRCNAQKIRNTNNSKCVTSLSREKFDENEHDTLIPQAIKQMKIKLIEKEKSNKIPSNFLRYHLNKNDVKFNSRIWQEKKQQNINSSKSKTVRNNSENYLNNSSEKCINNCKRKMKHITGRISQENEDYKSQYSLYVDKIYHKYKNNYSMNYKKKVLFQKTLLKQKELILNYDGVKNANIYYLKDSENDSKLNQFNYKGIQNNLRKSLTFNEIFRFKLNDHFHVHDGERLMYNNLPLFLKLPQKNLKDFFINKNLLNISQIQSNQTSSRNQRNNSIESHLNYAKNLNKINVSNNKSFKIQGRSFSNKNSDKNVNNNSIYNICSKEYYQDSLKNCSENTLGLADSNDNSTFLNKQNSKLIKKSKNSNNNANYKSSKTKLSSGKQNPNRSDILFLNDKLKNWFFPLNQKSYFNNNEYDGKNNSRIEQNNWSQFSREHISKYNSLNTMKKRSFFQKIQNYIQKARHSRSFRVTKSCNERNDKFDELLKEFINRFPYRKKEF